MKTAFLVAFLANLALTAVAWMLSPPEVAIHFGAGGAPDGWAPAYVNVLLMTGVNLLIFSSFFFAPALIRITPARWVNLPNKAYWLREEHRDRALALLAAHLHRFGTATFAFMFALGLLTLQANLSEPVRLREDLFWWAFGLYMAYAVFWTSMLARAFRVPQPRHPGPGGKV